MKKKTFYGLMELLLASIIYGGYGIFYRYVSEFGTFSSAWIRGLIMALIFLFIFLINKSKWKSYKKKDLKWFALWIIPSSIQPIFTFLAFNNLPVGLVYFLLYAAVVITSYISGAIFYKEKINFQKGLALLSVIIGISFIYSSDITIYKDINVVFALLSGTLIGLWNTLTKKLSDNYSEEQMIFTDNLSVVIVGLTLTLFSHEAMPFAVSALSWLWIFLFSIASIMTGVLIVRGFNKVEAQIGSLIVPTEIIFGSIFGYIFFKELLSTNIYIGGFLIFLATIIPNIKLNRKSAV